MNIKSRDQFFSLLHNIYNGSEQYYSDILSWKIKSTSDYVSYLYTIQDARILKALDYIENIEEKLKIRVIKQWIGIEFVELYNKQVNENDIEGIMQKKYYLNMKARFLVDLENTKLASDWFIKNYSKITNKINNYNKVQINNELILYIFKCYYNTFENCIKKLQDSRNNNILNVYSTCGYDLNCEKQYSKYKLILLSNDRELLDIERPRIYDKIIDKTFFIKNMPFLLIKQLKELYKNNLIGDLSFLLSNMGFQNGKYDIEILNENLQFGKVFDLAKLKNIDSRIVSKLYSKEFQDTLWVTIDNENITFEEMKENFDIKGDYITTQMIHLQYKQSNDKIYITHFDHEYIFYTVDEYDIRINNINQKGSVKKRQKSFKADNCKIPVNYYVKYEIKEFNTKKGEFDYKVINIPFIFFILDNYFEHKDLLMEYFSKIII